MNLFSCDNCGSVLFFENTVCTTCGQPVGYCVEARALVALPRDPAKASGPFKVSAPGLKKALYRKCESFSRHDACNWLVSVADRLALCRSCRLTEQHAELLAPDNRAAWLEIERGKRRLLHTLYALRLPVVPKSQDPAAGLAFRFLRGTPDKPVMTGHDEGLITLNLAEANDSFRENMREMMGEAYRTVLGHLRHESGHYYWDRLIRSGPSLAAFRELFGDDRQSYQDALKRHYDQGPPSDWRDSFISAYATMHPWEDWAETWAHYLHMVDTLETAKAHGLTLRVPGNRRGRSRVDADALQFADYESLSTGWQAVTLALNDLNRSMGVKDAYPFVLSPAVHTKLRFVHDVVLQSAPARRRPSAPRSARPGALSAQLFGWLRPAPASPRDPAPTSSARRAAGPAPNAG